MSPAVSFPFGSPLTEFDPAGARVISDTARPSTAKGFAPRLGLIIVLALVGRILVILAVPTRPASDFWAYFQRAQSLAQSGRYESFPGRPDAIQPPGYPLLLSLIFRAAPSSDHLVAAKIANAALGGLAVAIMGAWTRRLWGAQAGLWAAAILAFFPRSLLMADLVASENLFSPLLLTYLLVVTESRSRPRAFGLAGLAGVIVGILALTRTVGYALALVWLAGRAASRCPIRVLLIELALLLAVEHAVLLPWAIRNATSVGRFTFLNTSGGVGLFAGNNPNATGEWYAWEPQLERLRPGILARSDTEIDDAARKEGLRWIRENPGKATAFYIRRLWIVLRPDAIAAYWAISARTMTPPEARTPVLRGPHLLKKHLRAVDRTLRLSTVLLALAALGGLALIWTRDHETSDGSRSLAVIFLAAITYFPLVSALNVANGRYRWPSEDAAIPVAALFFSNLPRLVRAARPRRSLAPMRESTRPTLDQPGGSGNDELDTGTTRE